MNYYTETRKTPVMGEYDVIVVFDYENKGGIVQEIVNIINALGMNSSSGKKNLPNIPLNLIIYLTAASLSIDRNLTPRTLDGRLVVERMKADGALL